MRIHTPQRSGAQSAQRGFSIVELMVAVGLSMMLLMGVVALFVSSRSNYETTERLSRIQENGRYALDQLINNAREAGFPGCTRGGVTPAEAVNYLMNTLTSPTEVLFDFANATQGYDSNGGGVWTPMPDTAAIGLPADLDEDSDILVLRGPRRDSIPLRLATGQAAATDALSVPAIAGANVGPNDVVMISDCFASAIFSVTTFSGGIMTHTTGNPDLRHRFNAGAEIVPIEATIYYIAPPTVSTDPTQRSLWRMTSTGVPEELAEGIERMEVQYGEDTNGDSRVDRYVTAAIASWANVYSLRIALLARSPEPYGNDRDSRSYTLLDQTVPAPNDRNQRQVFTSTVALRNLVVD